MTALINEIFDVLPLTVTSWTHYPDLALTCAEEKKCSVQYSNYYKSKGSNQTLELFFLCFKMNKISSELEKCQGWAARWNILSSHSQSPLHAPFLGKHFDASFGPFSNPSPESCYQWRHLRTLPLESRSRKFFPVVSGCPPSSCQGTLLYVWITIVSCCIWPHLSIRKAV